MALRKIGRDPVLVEAICGAVARAALSQERKNGPTSVEKRPVTCRLVLRLEVSQRTDNRLVEAGEPLQVVAPVRDELSNQTVILVAPPQTLIQEPWL